jgi:hypothetical protein
VANELKDYCARVSLSETRDSCVCLLEKNGVFSVKSIYVALKTKNSVYKFKDFWGVRIPLRVKVLFG